MADATPLHPYRFADTLQELDGGAFERKVSAILHRTAQAVVANGGAGKVTVTLDLKQIGNANQINLKHKLAFTSPTPRGKASEEETTDTPLWVSRKGLTLMPDNQEKFQFDTEADTNRA